MTHDQNTLIGFLRARIDELEEHARQQEAGVLAASGTAENPHDASDWITVVVDDCYAKRAILDFIELPPDPVAAEHPKMDDDAGWALQRVMRHMAEPWSGHPQYQPVWRP